MESNYIKSKKEILKEIRIYDAYVKQAKQRQEYDVEQYYHKHLKTLWKKYKNSSDK